MDLIKSFQSELIKVKRTSLWYLCFIAAAFIPVVFLIELAAGTADGADYPSDPWNLPFMKALEFNAIFFLPLLIILLAILLLQIEYKNNTWKQVFTSPQQKINLFITKFITIHFFILLFFLANNILMILALVIVNFLVPSFNLFEYSMDLNAYLSLYGKIYISLIAMSAIQLWIGIRFRNFIAPIAVGIVLYFSAGILTLEYNWAHSDKFPYAFSMLIITNKVGITSLIPAILGYTAFFLGLGYFDFRKSRRMIAQ